MSFKWSIPSLMAASLTYDEDAYAFFIATGINDNTIRQAVNNLVLKAKANGWWSLCSAIYPIVGGTADTHKINLKDPRDLDAAYRLTFSGGITHASTGMTGNGSSGYGNTHLSPNVFGIDDIHLSYYSRTNNTTIATDIGCYNTLVSLTRITLYNSSGNNYSSLNDFSFPTFAVTDTSVYEITSRTSAADIATYQDGVFMTRSGTAPSSSIPNYDIYILAMNNANTADEYSNRECAFATIGTGLTSTQAANMNADVAAFQAALSRANS